MSNYADDIGYLLITTIVIGVFLLYSCAFFTPPIFITYATCYFCWGLLRCFYTS
jgi:hypothetical protein